MIHVYENQINAENTAVSAIDHLRRFRDIILCRGENGTCCCSCTECKFTTPGKSKKSGYRRNRAHVAGESTVAGSNKWGENVQEKYNGIIIIKENEESRRRRDGENEKNNSHFNEKISKGRVSRRDKHEEKKAGTSVIEENVEKVDEKRLGGRVARRDKHEKEKGRTSVQDSVEKVDEGYAVDVPAVDAVPEEKSSTDFRSETNTINESGADGRRSRKAKCKTQLEDENGDKVSPAKSEMQDVDGSKKQREESKKKCGNRKERTSSEVDDMQNIVILAKLQGSFEEQRDDREKRHRGKEIISLDLDDKQHINIPVKSEVQCIRDIKKQRGHRERKQFRRKENETFETNNGQIKRISAKSVVDDVVGYENQREMKHGRRERESLVEQVDSSNRENNKALDSEKADKDITFFQERKSRRHRSEKEISSGKDGEQTIEDTKGQIVEMISRSDRNENKERERGELSKRRKPRKEIKDANESLVGTEARLQAKKNGDVLSDEKSPVVSQQEESGIDVIHEEEPRGTRGKIKKKINCANVDQEIQKFFKDKTFVLVHDVINQVLTSKKLMSTCSHIKRNKASESNDIPRVGKAEYNRRKDGAKGAEVKGDQARKEYLEAAEVSGHVPTFEIKSEGDMGKQNDKTADKPSESDVSSVDVIRLSNDTLSVQAGSDPVQVKAVDSSPAIKRRKSVTFDTSITKIHLYPPDDEEFSSYQENQTCRKFPDGEDDFVMYNSMSMNESQPLQHFPTDTSLTETVNLPADPEPMLQPVDTATSKQDINYQAILEYTHSFVNLLNENDLKQDQSVASKAVEPVFKAEDVHTNKLDMVSHEDEEDQRGYEYEEEEEQEEEKADYNTSSDHKDPSKYSEDESLHRRVSAVGQDDDEDDDVAIPSGHSDLIWPKEVADSQMTTGQPSSIQAASSLKYPSPPKSRAPYDGRVTIKNTKLPFDYDQDDQLGMCDGSTSPEEEAQQSRYMPEVRIGIDPATKKPKLLSKSADIITVYSADDFRESDEGQDGRELWRTNLPPPLPKPDLLAPNPFPRRGNSLPAVRGPPSQTSATISRPGRILGKKSNGLSKAPVSDISHDLAKESARIPTTMPSKSRPFDPIQGRKLEPGCEADDVLFQPPNLRLEAKHPLKNNFKEILAPINGRSPSPVLHDVLFRENVPHSYPIPQPPSLPRQAWSERNIIHGVEGCVWGIDVHTITPHEEEPCIHYPHPPPTPGPEIHYPHPPSMPVTSTSSASQLRRRYNLRVQNIPGFHG